MAERKIVGFHQDHEGHWTARLNCGHAQHVRHTPPWQNRPWVLSPSTRAEKLGCHLQCVKCDAGDPVDGDWLDEDIEP